MQTTQNTDKVISIEPGKSIVAIKNVTINEPYFLGHFPGNPIMPGVLILEAMAQATGILALHANRENKEGFFLIYKRVINRIVGIVNEVNPTYPYAKSLVSTIVEGSLHQHFLTEHLTTITDCNDSVSTTQFYLNLTENVLR